MANESVVNVPLVTRFVRQVLGCNCSEEVFRRIEVSRGSSAVRSCDADYELRIGGRLLIVVTSDLAASQLEQVVAEGKRARDAATFNRFRLVVQTENAGQNREKLLEAFERLTTRDEKTHLHVVNNGEVPDFFLQT